MVTFSPGTSGDWKRWPEPSVSSDGLGWMAPIASSTFMPTTILPNTA